MIDTYTFHADAGGNICGHSIDVNGQWCYIHEAQAAVKKFLTAEGHDLCHENRRELAEAFGLTDVVPKPPADRNEFRQKCHEYEEQIYGPLVGGQHWVEPDPSQNITFHLTNNGRAICGRPGYPKDWPEDHHSVPSYSLQFLDRVNCEGCLKAMGRSSENRTG